jgi:hypothetical protein
MDQNIKRRKLDNPDINIMNKDNIAIIETIKPNKPNIYCIVEDSDINNYGRCLICNIDLGDNTEQLCNKIYCSNS